LGNLSREPDVVFSAANLASWQVQRWFQVCWQYKTAGDRVQSGDGVWEEMRLKTRGRVAWQNIVGRKHIGNITMYTGMNQLHQKTKFLLRQEDLAVL
jgi:hypothetical protein